MRVHISLDDRLISQLDRRVGRRKRSAFIAETVRQALEDQRRWDDIVASFGKIADTGVGRRSREVGTSSAAR